MRRYELGQVDFREAVEWISGVDIEGNGDEAQTKRLQDDRCMAKTIDAVIASTGVIVFNRTARAAIGGRNCGL